MTTGIEWTDETWNPVAGCTPVSPGCAHCYAATMARRLGAMAAADIAAERSTGRKLAYLGTTNDHGKWTGVVNTIPEALDDPFSWKRPRKIFVNSMSDLFHPAVPEDFLDRTFAAMALNPRHTFQVLTKQPQRMLEYSQTIGKTRRLMEAQRFLAKGRGLDLMNAAAIQLWPLPNVWFGVSVEDQPRADERIPLLLKTPAAVRFLSCEPLLGVVDLSEWMHGELDCDDCFGDGQTDGADCVECRGHGSIPCNTCLDWVIVGGESGSHARPCNVGWIADIVGRCQDAEVPVFVKQLGGKVQHGNYDGWPPHITRMPNNAEETLGIRDPKGGDWSEWPEFLRVRQFPQTEAIAHV